MQNDNIIDINNFDKSIKRHIYISIIITAIPILIALLYVIKYTYNAPVTHDWCFFEAVKNSNNLGELIKYIWSPQNGHRNLIIQIIYLIDYYVFGFNTVHFCYLSFIILFTIWYGIWKLFKTYFDNNLFSFLPITLTLFSLVQYKDLTTAWQLTVLLGTAGGIWAFYFANKGGIKNIVLASLFFILSFYTFGNGLMIAPWILILLIAKRKSKYCIYYWTVFSFLSIILYFWNYNIGTSTINPTAIFTKPLNSIMFLLSLIGSPSGYLFNFAGRPGVFICVLIGIFYLIAIAIFCILLIKNRSYKEYYLPLIFLLYILSVYCLITFGRMNRGANAARAYWHFPLQSSAPIITLGIVSLKQLDINEKIKKWRKYLITLLMISMVIHSLLALCYGLSWGPYVKGEGIKQEYKMLHYRDYNYNIPINEYLEQNKKSVFKNKKQTDYFLHVFELDKFTEESTNYQYIDTTHSNYIFIIPVKSSKLICILAHSYHPMKNDSLIINIYKKENDIPIFQKSISAQEISKEGRAIFNLEEANFMYSDLLLISLIRKGNSINIFGYDYYPGCPIPSNEIKDNKTISLEVNPPNELKGYYRQIERRQKLKYIINNSNIHI